MNLYALEQVEKNSKICNLDKSLIAKWIEKVLNKINDKFQLEEVIYFATAEEINNCTVNLNPDKLFLIQHFNEATTVKNANLQHPDETFGKKMLSEQCIKCKNYNTIRMQRQARSIDEPGRTDFKCLDRCGHEWSIK